MGMPSFAVLEEEVVAVIEVDERAEKAVSKTCAAEESQIEAGPVPKVKDAISKMRNIPGQYCMHTSSNFGP